LLNVGLLIPTVETPTNILRRLDRVAGFSHDFRYLDGHKSPVTTTFEALQEQETSFISDLVSILISSFPFLLSLPTQRILLFRDLHHSLNNIAERLLENARREK
jgi:hypothetical protein